MSLGIHSQAGAVVTLQLLSALGITKWFQMDRSHDRI